MSLKYAILGFLSYQSMSGYELKKAFDQSVQHFWPANQSQIYRTLAKMTDEGLVIQEVIEREDRLDMKIYHLTEQGREDLHQWLSSPLPVTDFREPFLIQLFFGGQLSDAELLSVLKAKIEALEAEKADYLTRYEAFREGAGESQDRRSYFLSILTMEFGINSGLAELDWLKSVVRRIEAGDYDLKDFDL